MNKEIQQLVKEVTPLGDPFRGKNPAPYRWQKAMRLWNKVHSLEQTTLEAVECAFKDRWPCSIIEYSSNGKILKISTPYLEFSVRISPNGMMHGYVNSMNGKRIKSDIFMSTSQLTEFLSYIFYSKCNRTDMDELESRLSKLPAEIDRYISNINQNPQNEPLSAEQAIKIFELYYEKYSWLSRLNWHEEALDAVKDALLYFNVIGQFEERNDCTLYTCIIGNGPFPYDTIEYFLYADLSHTLLMLGRLNESIMFYHSLYDRKLKYIEQNCIWPGYNFDGLDETERYAETVAYIAEYCRWVEEYCRLLSLSRQGNKANQLLDQAIRTMKNITILKKEDSFFYLEQLEYCKKEIPL